MEAIDYQIKSPVLCGAPPFKLLFREVSQTPRKMQISAIILGSTGELDGKILLQKLAHISHRI